MAQFFGIVKLRRPEDWDGVAGKENWVAGRSAYELAYAWHQGSGIPKPIKAALDEANVEQLHALTLDVGFVEKPVFLDTQVGPSMTDLMAYATNGQGERVVIAVEGKATESFALPVRAWLRGDRPIPSAGAAPRKSRLRRLKFLCDQLGVPCDEESTLYYQLLHRTVSGLMEGKLYGAAAAVLVIHSFSSSDHENFSAYTSFIEALGAPPPTKGVVSGPMHVPGGNGMPLFALWVSAAPRVGAA